MQRTRAGTELPWEKGLALPCLAGMLTLSAADARPGRGSPGVERGGPQGRAGHHAVGSLASHQLGSSVLQPGHRLPQLHLGGGPRCLVPPGPGRGQAAAEQGLGGLGADAAVGGLAVAVRCGAKGTDSGWVRNERVALRNHRPGTMLNTTACVYGFLLNLQCS